MIQEEKEMIEEKKINTKSIIIITVAVILIILIVIAVAYFAALNAISNTGTELEIDNKSETKKSIIYPLGEFTTNLSDKGFIKLKIELEVKDKATVAVIENRNFEYKDKIINIIRGKTLSEVNGKEGMEILRTSIKNELNRLQGSGNIINVFFTEMIIN